MIITLQFLPVGGGTAYSSFERRPDTQLFKVKVVSNNNSSLAKSLTELSFHVSLCVCGRLTAEGKNNI